MPIICSAWPVSLRQLVLVWLCGTAFDGAIRGIDNSVAHRNLPFGASASEIIFDENNRISGIERVGLDISISGPETSVSNGVSGYQAEFTGLDRSILGRAGQSGTELGNNIFQNDNVNPGSTNHYAFSPPNPDKGPRQIWDKEEFEQNITRGQRDIEARGDEFDSENEKRAVTFSTVFITINTCLQPQFDTTINNPPQLTLFLSTSDSNQEPGPGSPPAIQQDLVLQQGYASIAVNTTGKVYIGVYGQSSGVTSGAWNYELTASIDQPYHHFNASLVTLYLIDSDRNSSLLISRNLSSAMAPFEDSTAWLENGPPLSLFVQNDITALQGMTSSYCALKQNAQLSTSNAADGITTGLVTYSNNPIEQQFYIPNLIGQTSYSGILAYPNNPNHPGGGGSIYGSATFETKRFANCQLLYNLSFCSSVAYAVPANPATYQNYTSLAALYDNTTSASYQNFNYSLQQIPCNTTATAQYSLAKTCTDCAAAYKTWLCAVSIPRCADWNASAPLPDRHDSSYLMPRNVAQSPIAATPDIALVTNNTLLNWIATNSSRNNDTIAGAIMPGPYAEVLPCEDLCYELVRACPAALGFGCPYRGKGLEWSYGIRGTRGPDGGPTCSEPGAVWGVSAGVRMRVGVLWVVAWVVVVGFGLVV